MGKVGPGGALPKWHGPDCRPFVVIVGDSPECPPVVDLFSGADPGFFVGGGWPNMAPHGPQFNPSTGHIGTLSPILGKNWRFSPPDKPHEFRGISLSFE